MDFRDLDRQAMKLAGDVISHVRPDQLRLPTPCADWTLHGLLRHLVSEDLAFAAATTAGTDPSDVDWNAGRLGADPVADYQRTAAAYLVAFEPDEVLDRRMRINTFGVFPGSVAVSMHFIDTRGTRLGRGQNDRRAVRTGRATGRRRPADHEALPTGPSDTCF